MAHSIASLIAQGSSFCPLCSDIGTVFYQGKKQLFYQCQNCSGIFLHRELTPDRATEKSRYEEHNNDIYDKKYQMFVAPVTSAILRDFDKTDQGLDFGAGTGPVISKILNDHSFQIVQYDPFFFNYPDLLTRQYAYIACCEVIEHFHNPKKEFSLLKKLLLPAGKLYCMTSLYDESIDFHTWNYRNDKTHVFIYHEKTIHWLQKAFQFSDVTIEGRLITYFA